MQAQQGPISAVHGPLTRRAAAYAATLLGVVVIAGSVEAAEPSPQVRAALEVLAGAGASGSAHGGSRPVAPVSASPGAPPSSSGAPHDATGAARAKVVVARGQSLDALVKSHYAASPLKPEAVRDAVIRLNPQAFPPDPRRRLPTGTELLLPTRDDLMRHAFGVPSVVPPSEAVVEAATGPGVGARRGWVRYP